MILACVLAGCTGEDLSKANFERSTIQAEPGSGQGEVPTGPIDDPAVSLPALRTVDPCRLLTERALGDFDSVEDPFSVDWGQCSVEAQDAEGQSVQFRLDLGTYPVLDGEATGNVEGLPLIERQTEDTTCFSTAVTSRQPGFGILLHVDYPSGNACGPAYRVLSLVIQNLHADPPQYEQRPGSLIGVDPCASMDDGDMSEILGEEVTGELTDLNLCRFDAQSKTVLIRFGEGYPPDPDHGTEADLGGGITGVRQTDSTGVSECTVSWEHRSISGTQSEVVQVDHQAPQEDGNTDEACTTVIEVARNLITALPTP